MLIRDLGKYINFKTSIGPSLISKFTPNNLTPEMKLTLAKHRIFGNIIGGNLRTGLRHLRDPLKGQSKLDYFRYAFEDESFPFRLQTEDPPIIGKQEELKRREKRGKVLLFVPVKNRNKIPKYDRKKILHVGERRKARVVALGMRAVSIRKRR